MNLSVGGVRAERCGAAKGGAQSNECIAAPRPAPLQVRGVEFSRRAGRGGVERSDPTASTHNSQSERPLTADHPSSVAANEDVVVAARVEHMPASIASPRGAGRGGAGRGGAEGRDGQKQI